VATQLEFTVNANGCDTDVQCSTQPVVAIEDYLANTITTSTVTVTLSIKSGLGYLLGTTSVSAVDGIATFSDLRFSATGSYVITASITHGSATITVNSGCISVYGPGMIIETATPTGAPTRSPTIAGSYVLTATMTLTGMTSAEFLQPSIVAAFKSTLVRSFESTSLTITTEDLTITSPSRRSSSVDVTTEINSGTTDADAAASAGSAMDSYVSGGSFTSDLSSATGVTLSVSGYSSAVTQPSSADQPTAQQENGGLSAGAIAAIAVVAAVVLTLVVAAAVVVVRSRRGRRTGREGTAITGIGDSDKLPSMGNSAITGDISAMEVEMVDIELKESAVESSI
jgi:hypothetical protein